MTITYKGKEYELARTLRVAYKVQGQNNHESYLSIFNRLDSMTIEEQIGIIYASFSAANPEDAKFIKQTDFLNECLDTMDLSSVMNTIQYIIEGIMGKELTDTAKAEVEADRNEADENFQK